MQVRESVLTRILVGTHARLFDLYNVGTPTLTLRRTEHEGAVTFPHFAHELLILTPELGRLGSSLLVLSRRRTGQVSHSPTCPSALSACYLAKVCSTDERTAEGRQPGCLVVLLP